MADALVSSLIEQLASTALDQTKENVKLVLDVENELHQFVESLQKIQPVLKDAEKRQVAEAFVRVWLDNLKEVSYEMENVLDELNNEALKQQIEKQENEGDTALVNNKKVCFSIPSPCNCFCFGQGSREIVVVGHDIAGTIKQLNSRLTLIAEDRQRFQFQSTTTSGIEEPQRPANSLVKYLKSVDYGSAIFGREPEKHTLISMLLGYSTSTGAEERGLLVISIVGMGGIGKTTLAQLVYNDENVKDHFVKSIWVCVSDPFDNIQIAKAIIGEDDTLISDELDTLMQSVSQSVKGNRFLLVLDDVWTENDIEWSQLKSALMSGAKGSRILVTTRKVMVARMMNAHMIFLEKLSEQICSLLFYHIAFFDRKKDEIESFEVIGNKIVKMCKGLPLIAKILGCLMRYKNTRKEWQDVLNSPIWDLSLVEQSLFRPLLLSYYDLPSKIKSCLLFCASFPKDYQFEVHKLIELWMSQNYLNSKNQDKRSIGQNYFDELLIRSFFQDFEFDALRNLALCKMHDIVHDFVQFLTKDECFIIEGNGANQENVRSIDSVHHLTLMLAAEDLPPLPTLFHTYKKLRGLTVFSKEITTIDGDLILPLKCLRAFNLSKSNVKKLPKEIGELLNLRYIDLSYNFSLKELPDAMCNLCNLETLHLEWCGLEKLPEAMGKLINLKRLYVDQCSQLSCLPKGLGRLKGLRILGKYTFVRKGFGDDNRMLELGDLGTFVQLQGTLEIAKLGNVKDVREGQKEQL